MMFARLIAFLGLLFLPSIHYAQWSTSTRAESTLYVCPGFYPGIVTFDDGSSIVLGALQSYIFARKLDERGYYMWTPPVQVVHNDSSFITDVETKWGGYVSDGDGGVIVFWYDHRGAYRDQQTGRWLNNAIYAQRVDKFGMVRWTSGGVLVKGPGTGLKNGGISNDGLGGCLISWIESEFGFPGARNKERARIQRVSNTGTQLWELTIDSSAIQYSLGYGAIVRAQDRLFIPATSQTRMFSLDGNPIANPALGPSHLLLAEKDSVLFNLIAAPPIIIQRKLTATLDTLWTAISNGGAGSETALNNPAVPDGVGGVYYIRSRIDSTILVRVRRVDGRGEVWPSELVVRGIGIPTGGFEGHGGIIIGDHAARVWRFDSLGYSVWQNPLRMLNNPGATYFGILSSDNNGGMIMVFWHTLGGIYAHHSGRSGHVGIITTIDKPLEIPSVSTLLQNYPNPFNPTTVIPFSIASKGAVNLKVFDVLGREVRTLVDDILEPGLHSVQFDALALSSGVYFYRLETRKSVQVKQMLFLK